MIYAQVNQKHQRSRRQIKGLLVRQSIGLAVVIFGSTAGMLSMTHHVLVEPVVATRVLVESSHTNSCGELTSWETSGGIVVYIMLLGYIFASLAIVCDDYFVSALEKISGALALSPDVVGATFMAAGSSAPELLVALADNVLKKPAESLGVGTIVGAATFNVLVIISLSGLLAGQVLELDWRPLLRDSIWYTWAITVLAFAVWDGSIDLLDSVIMMGSYGCYIGYMAFNERLVNCCCKRPTANELQDMTKIKLSIVIDSDSTTTAKVVSNTESSQNLVEDTRCSHSHDRLITKQDKLNPILRCNIRQIKTQQLLSPPDEIMNVESHHSAEKNVGNASGHEHLSDVPAVNYSEKPLPHYFDSVLVPAEGGFAKLRFFLTWPIKTLARTTIPDCRYPIFSGPIGYSATFVISIIWIGMLSHYTVAIGTKLGCITGIPPAVMGLTVIAAGTSIPDALSSIIVARDGQGDMAVSNALGSNIFNLLFGLGLPFFLSNLIYRETVPISGNDFEISVAILFAVLLLVVAVIALSRWKLYPFACVLLLMLYVAYVAFSYLHGLNII